MRPISSNTSAGVRIWSSPIPYLFIGLALMMGLIAIALVILVCSHRKSSGNSSTSPAMKERPENIVVPPEIEPERQNNIDGNVKFLKLLKYNEVRILGL
ncbi:hypothetical protein J5N97_002767 [Dioscorea zingiberensis]|uniref:Uncharacterized protein n=1 Tax=Dioscorea zingiberensis TaxID=325984 RepID=A0A9D5D2X2_9LILI|nr:hypothetical protein J5N97_002767 [Dioscorea zingiberensis]